MCPVVERIAQAVRNRSGPRHIFVIRRRIPRDVSFRNPICAHRPPLVVISLEPDLKKICEAPVVGDVLRAEMTVVVEDWLGRGKLMVETPRRFVRE